jgi:hypothetical protein
MIASLENTTFNEETGNVIIRLVEQHIGNNTLVTVIAKYYAHTVAVALFVRLQVSDFTTTIDIFCLGQWLQVIWIKTVLKILLLVTAIGLHLGGTILSVDTSLHLEMMWSYQQDNSLIHV